MVCKELNIQIIKSFYCIYDEFFLVNQSYLYYFFSFKSIDEKEAKRKKENIGKYRIPINSTNKELSPTHTWRFITSLHGELKTTVHVSLRHLELSKDGKF